jgi:hypothetical protein
MSDPNWPMSRRRAMAEYRISVIISHAARIEHLANMLPDLMGDNDLYEECISQIRTLSNMVKLETDSLPDMHPDEEVTA